MPARQTRITIKGRPVLVLLRDILTRFHTEEEERFWASEGEERLATFDRKTSVPHEDSWS